MGDAAWSVDSWHIDGRGKLEDIFLAPIWI